MAEAVGHRAAVVRRLLAAAAGATLLALAALLLLLLSEHDAHAATLGPLDVPVQVPALPGTTPTPGAATPPAPATPVEQTVTPILDTVDRTATPILDTIDRTATPILDTIDQTATPILDTIDRTAGAIVAPLDIAPPAPPTAALLPGTGLGVHAGTADALPSTLRGVTNSAAPSMPPGEAAATPLPHALGDETVRSRSLVPVASTAPVTGSEQPSTPVPAPWAPPFLAHLGSQTTSSSLDTAQGLQLLLFAIAATLAALYLARRRRVLPFGAVTPRYLFVSLIERPG